MSIELATAYVSIVPSAKGIGGKVAAELAPVQGIAAATGATAGKKLSGGMLGGLSGVGGKALGILGFASIGVAAFKSAEDVEAALNTIRVGTGKTGAELERLEGSFRNVAKQTPANFADVGIAVADLNSRLDVTGPRLEDLSLKFLQLSRITKTDLKTDIRDLTRVFGDWGIGTDQQSGALDKMFRATQLTGVGLNDLAQNVVQFGAPLRNLGFTFDESLAIFSKFEKEGVNIQTVLSGLRFGLKNFAKAGEEPVEALQRVITQIQNAKTTAEANAIAFKVFGQRAGPDMAAAIREGRFELDDLIAGIKNGKDTISSAAGDVSTFSGKLGILKNNAKLAFAEFGAPALTIAQEGLAALIPLLQGTVGLLELVEPAIGPATVGLVAFFAAAKLGAPILGAATAGIERLALGAASFGAERTFAGLAGFSGFLSGLGARLPGIAAAGTIAATSFSGIGESAAGSAIGVGSLMATGALVGSSFGPWGTVIGAAAGGVVGLTKAIISGGESVEEYRKKFVDLVSTIETLTAKKAAQRFIESLGFTDFGQLFGGSARAITDELRAMAAASPAAAQSVVDGLRAIRNEDGKPLLTPKEFEKLEAAVAKGAGTFQSLNEKKRESAAIDAAFASGQDASAAALAGEAASADAATSAIQTLHDAVAAATGGQLGYEAAVRNIERAQADLNTAITEYGAGSPQARDAQIALQQAQLQGAAAAQTLDGATSQLAAKFKDTSAIDTEIARLEALKAKHPEVAAGYDLQILKLLGLRAQLDSLPPGKHIPVTADTDDAKRKLDDLAGVIRQIGNVTVSYDAQGRPVRRSARGAYFPAKPGGWFVNLAEAGTDEAVITPDNPVGAWASIARLGLLDKMTESGVRAVAAPVGPGYGGGPPVVIQIENVWDGRDFDTKIDQAIRKLRRDGVGV